MASRSKSDGIYEELLGKAVANSLKHQPIDWAHVMEVLCAAIESVCEVDKAKVVVSFPGFNSFPIRKGDAVKGFVSLISECLSIEFDAAADLLSLCTLAATKLAAQASESSPMSKALVYSVRSAGVKKLSGKRSGSASSTSNSRIGSSSSFRPVQKRSSGSSVASSKSRDASSKAESSPFSHPLISSVLDRLLPSMVVAIIRRLVMFEREECTLEEKALFCMSIHGIVGPLVRLNDFDTETIIGHIYDEVDKNLRDISGRDTLLTRNEVALWCIALWVGACRLKVSDADNLETWMKAIGKQLAAEYHEEVPTAVSLPLCAIGIVLSLYYGQDSVRNSCTFSKALTRVLDFDSLYPTLRKEVLSDGGTACEPLQVLTTVAMWSIDAADKAREEGGFHGANVSMTTDHHDGGDEAGETEAANLSSLTERMSIQQQQSDSPVPLSSRSGGSGDPESWASEESMFPLKDTEVNAQLIHQIWIGQTSTRGTDTALDNPQVWSNMYRWASSLTHLHLEQKGITRLGNLHVFGKLQTLYAYNNLLQSLDGKRLEMCSRQLTYLYLQHNELTSLDGIQYCRQLRKLYVDHNRLASLDAVAELPDLQELHASNQVPSEDAYDDANGGTATHSMLSMHALDDIGGRGRLRVLRIAGCGINDNRILGGLALCPSLVDVSVANNELTDVGALVEYVQRATGLQEIAVASNRFRDSGGPVAQGSVVERVLAAANPALRGVDGKEVTQAFKATMKRLHAHRVKHSSSSLTSSPS